MLITKNIRHQYDKEITTMAFPDLQIDTGEKVLILGPSGCGKTTWLHILAGLIKPKEGEVWVNNVALHDLSESEMDRFRGNHIGIVFQRPHYIPSINVMENIMISSFCQGKPQDRERARALLDKLKLGHKYKASPEQLSSGEQQRLSIARALYPKPKILLADEPSSALDDYNCKQVIELLREATLDDQCTLIVVTHDQRVKEGFQKTIILNS